MSREEVVEQLVSTGKWSVGSARLGERACYRCEYCDLDLLATPEAYNLWQNDHIVPISRGGCPTDFDNLAVACKPCNWDFKSDWDPRDVKGPNANREDLIAAVRTYIKERKARKEEELARIRTIVGHRQRAV
jgi:hypothetical protein